MGTRTFFVHSDEERKQEQERREDLGVRARPLRMEEEQTHVRRADEPHPGAAVIGRVLLVDDHAELRRVWMRALRRNGHEICEASSGADALRQLAERAFDLVLSDIQMPDMSGLELLARVRSLDPNLAFLVLTGAPEASSVARAKELGAFEYMTKPVDLTRLTTTVGRGVLHTLRRRGQSHY